MKMIIYTLTLLGVISYQTMKRESSDIKHFFDTMSQFYCIDSSMSKFNLNFNYSFFNKENMAVEYRIPDSIRNSEFYNAFAGRIISSFYSRINSDTTTSYDELLTVNKCDNEVVKQKIVGYCSADETFYEIFSLAKRSFYENEKTEKEKLTIDSLVNISMSYFDIAGYSEGIGFVFHYLCGQNPFDFKVENKTALLIRIFCQEALRNPEMYKVYSEVTDSIRILIKKENEEIKDFQKIKRLYEPKLHGLLKEQKVIKELLISYYEQRKEIEPFILEY